MKNRWEQLETMAPAELTGPNAALGRRLRRYFPDAEGFDSVQFWLDTSTGKSVPFVLVTLDQLKDLWTRAKASAPAGVVEGSDKSPPPPTPPSTLQRKLAERLSREVEALKGATGMVFARTRTKSQSECKWVAELTRGEETILVGSHIPARDLVRGGHRLGIVGKHNGLLLIGYSGKQFEAIVAQLIHLGLYTGDVAEAIERARSAGSPDEPAIIQDGTSNANSVVETSGRRPVTKR